MRRIRIAVCATLYGAALRPGRLTQDLDTVVVR